ncbi:dopaminechrome tautomerase-like [Chironomus tepperi]|uniref:dopaminechrome tautomerase-like n=1 Tax=Chironomus tepperi TaxID=113505 RepID=UPI00391FA17F
MMSEQVKYVIFIILVTTTCVKMQRDRGPPDITPQERQFRVVYEWRTLDFAFRNEQERSAAIFRGEYIPKNVIISDIKPYANRLYLTTPRMLPGSPATLGYIIAPDNNGKTDPEIEPYPSWAMNQVGNCSALQFVQGIAIDARGILWAVDSGRVNTLLPANNQLVCNPKLMLFDLKRNGSLVLRYDFPEEVVARGTNYLNKIVVDDANGDFAYITDNNGADPGIVVFSRRINRAWKVRENTSMRANREALSFIVNGTSLNFSIHIDGIALGPYYNPSTGDVNTDATGSYSIDQNYERNVYYSPLSSYHLYSIPATRLRDPDFARRATPRQVFEAVTDHGLKTSQSDGMTMDNNGYLYFGLLANHAICKWDSYRPFTYDNQQIVARDKVHIQWTDGMGFDENGYLYVVVNRLHNFVAGRLREDQVNFRVLRSKTGTISYVHTGRPSLTEENILNIGGSGPIYEIHSNTLGSGISSTTPISLGSIGGQYYNSSSSTYKTTSLLLVGLLAVFIKYLI